MSNLFHGTSGPKDASIVLVGEAWGTEELSAQLPFVGNSGTELSRMLSEAGINRSEILLTNIVADKPAGNEMWRWFQTPGGFTIRKLNPIDKVVNGLNRLHEQIAAHPRALVIGAGNYPLWALSNCAGYTTPASSEGRRVPSGIMNWRGSMWNCEVVPGHEKTPLLPIIHPAAILRQWSLRAITIHDLKARTPMALRGDWRHAIPPVFWAPPTFDQAVSRLSLWISRANGGERIRIAADIETLPSRRLLVCIGLGDSKNFAMSIPFIRIGSGQITTNYWTHNEEVRLIDLLRRLLSHPNILIIGQNFNFDSQFIQRDWSITPQIYFDTMSAQHLLWPGTPKGLDYISSLYCNYHWYWKEDGKDWDLKLDLPMQLTYNCWDIVRTFEAAEAMETIIEQMGLSQQWSETRERHWLALRMMNKGVLIDRNKRADIGRRLMETATRLSSELSEIIPKWMLPDVKKGAKPVPWYNSPKQQKFVFQNILYLHLPKNRKTGRITLDKNALMELARKYPCYIGIFKRLGSLRSVEVFQSHFIGARLPEDGRMRCFFKIDGTETFRWSSAQNAFSEGANLQTIPSGDEE